MVSDSITNALIPSAPNARDLGRKKKTRTAKLKQSKLDVRREQWLSQVAVKSKKCKERVNGVLTDKSQMCKEENRSAENMETGGRGEENEGSINQDSDFSESPSNSPTSHTGSLLGGRDSGTHFGGSGSCCSGSITEEDGDDGCLDDWEAVADALAANDNHQSLSSKSSPEHESAPQLVSPHESSGGLSVGVGEFKPEVAIMIQRAPANSQAWRADDAFRPQSLPNLSKQLSLPNSNRNYRCGAVSWGRSTALSVPSSCPICYEDLDFTDASFLPCLCGFRLCLFCHKRIVEDDGRCPGCRKPYEHDPVKSESDPREGGQMFRLARSFSMRMRS